jgi:septal ring factor EnvC (AmiA/AmiB activator)
LVSTFGKKRSKNFNTYTFNNGIEIKPTGGDSIKSILPGIVLYSDYLKGYGNVLIVQHSSSFYSLYGHCSKFLVTSGQEVQRGEFIALAGDSGSLEGKSLYFEIRVNIDAKNPLNWLTKR